ncbi:hypothetical protein [Methyloraptor flagellatus]|uniref:RhiE-like KS-MAT linker domain-containing protein n=1 Tax=Methyloraptor flagellatus TaxID=3162530 RepID=A0AAU7XIA6_9HYPH
MIPLSARDEVGLRARAADLAAWLDRAAGPEIGDIAYTLQLGREAFDARAAAVVEEVAGLRRALAGIAAGEKRVTVPAGTTRQDIDKEAADALRDRRLDDLARLWGAGRPSIGLRSGAGGDPGGSPCRPTGSAAIATGPSMRRQ